MLEEIRRKGTIFQPPSARARRRWRRRPRRARARPGVHGRAVRRRDDEGDVARAQRRLQHVHSEHRRQRRVRAGQALLSAVCTRQDAGAITEVIHQDCMRRVGAAVAAARTRLVDDRRRPGRRALRAGHARSPVLRRSGRGTAGTFELTPEMLTYYGTPIDGQPETALTQRTGSFRTSGRCTTGSRPRFSTSSTTSRRIRR